MSTGIMYFRLLTEDAYIQTGNYTIQNSYNPNGDNFLYYNPVNPTDIAFPTYFNREWATLSNTEYDWGAYGTGLQVSKAEVTLPSVSRRTLLYFFDIRGTAERRTLVETTKTAAQLVAQGVIASDNVPVLLDYDQFAARFTPAGRLEFTGVPVLPQDMVVSQVSELYSYNATVDGVNLDGSDEAQPVQIYVSPTWLGNQYPLFSQIYFADDLVKYANGTYAVNAYQNKPIRQVRWFGGVPSENIAAINRAGTHLDFSGTKYTQVATVSDVAFSENGVTYINAESYNLVNLKRS